MMAKKCKHEYQELREKKREGNITVVFVRCKKCPHQKVLSRTIE